MFFSALLAAHMALGRQAAVELSATWDEPPFLAAGYSYWVTGKYRLDAWGHPPLSKLWNTIPLLRLRPDPKLDEMVLEPGLQSNNAYIRAFFFHNRVPAEAMLQSCRWMSLAWSIPLALLIFILARRFSNLWGAAAAVILYALSPSVLANMSLATTDGIFTFLFFSACAAFWDWERKPGGAPAALTGALLGLLVACKFYGVIVAGVLVFLAGRRALAFIISALAVLWLGDLPGGLAAYPLQLFAMSRAASGSPAFLGYYLGRFDAPAFWVYPVNFLVKTPIPLLLLLAGAFFLFLKEWKRDFFSRIPWPLVLPPLSFFFALFIISSYPPKNRYLLPLYPFVFLFCGVYAGRFIESRKSAKGRAWSLAALAGLIFWYAAGTIKMRPHYLAYFNEAAGGPRNGHKWFQDSDLDWGSEAKSAIRFIKAQGVPRAFMYTFQTEDFSIYDMKSPDLRSARRPDHPLWLGIPTTLLYREALLEKRPLFEWLMTQAPVHMAAYAFRIYDLSASPEALRLLAASFKENGDVAGAANLRKWAGQPLK